MGIIEETMVEKLSTTGSRDGLLPNRPEKNTAVFVSKPKSEVANFEVMDDNQSTMKKKSKEPVNKVKEMPATPFDFIWDVNDIESGGGGAGAPGNKQFMGARIAQLDDEERLKVTTANKDQPLTKTPAGVNRQPSQIVTADMSKKKTRPSYS